MSQDDLDGVRAAWKAISENDLEGFLEKVDPEVEFTSLVAEAEAAVYRGHAGARRWWQAMHETFTDIWTDAMHLREVGDFVLAQIVLCGTVRDTRVEQTMWQVLRVENGRVVWWRVFRTEAEALEAIHAHDDALQVGAAE